MTSRRLQGLMELYPFLTRKLSESSVDRDVERNQEASKSYMDNTIPEESDGCSHGSRMKLKFVASDDEVAARNVDSGLKKKNGEKSGR
ncbi:hypothetical protein PoB_003102300 [Plakobranchus ocellatus]|uniref:Uncharacterized protein n=1 Tax=Plakobranchus ocellatus TaxID=259542 RepID=A0AAV4ACN1_9GAST|nr:hypothetical protein PoB_003102300 [Plakobranchus ocellatus]